MAAPPKTNKRLLLLAPAYRRWLTPDAGELQLRAIGLTATELRAAQARLIVVEGDTGDVRERLFTMHGDAEWTLPAPRLHSGGEVSVAVEDARSGDVMVEGQWRVRSPLPEDIANSIYFDSRRVMLRGGVAFAPRFWLPPATAIRERILADAQALGANGVALWPFALSDAAERERAADAERRGLGVVVSIVAPEPVGDFMAAVTKRIQLLRDEPAIIAYALVAPSKPLTDPLELYRVTRRTDPTRPVLAIGGGPWDTVAGQEFVDMRLAEPAEESATGFLLPELIHWSLLAANVNAADTALTPRGRLYAALIHATAGIVVAGDPGDSNLKHIMTELAMLDESRRRGAPVAAAGPLPDQVRFWGRRIDDQYLIAFLNDGPGARTVDLPADPSWDGMFVVGEARTLRVRERLARETLPARGPLVLTNVAKWAQALATASAGTGPAR